MCFYPPLPPDPDEGSKVTLSGFVKLNYCRHFQLNFRQKNKLSGRTAIITYLVLKTYNYCSFYHQLFSHCITNLYSYLS